MATKRIPVPPRFPALAGWALLPLRAFLGFTFLFAGLQKLANPTFFDPNSPTGIHAQLVAANGSSPLGFLLGHLIRFSTPLGVVIALGEVAVGLGVLLGLWTRLAALGGMFLSLMLFLTVSFHSSPYYTGSDIVFFFAWTPLVVAGAGGVLSVDMAIAAQARRERGMSSPELVAIPFAVVTGICGNFEDGSCRARMDRTCASNGCPFLAGMEEPVSALHPDDVDRRRLLLGGVAAAGVGVFTLAGAGAAAGIGRVIGGAEVPRGDVPVALGSKGSGAGSAGSANGSPTTAPPSTGSGATTPTTAAPTTTTGPKIPNGRPIGPAADVPVSGSATFTDPKSGDPSLVLRLSTSSYVAYDAVCPHEGCTVGYAQGASLIVCPCHGSEFNPQNGDVVHGPATRGLTPIPVAENGSGQLVVPS